MSTSDWSRKRSKKQPRATSPAKPRKTRANRAASTSVDHPFAPDIWKSAAELASAYRLTFEQDPDVGFIGSSVELPTVFADGSTLAQCAKETLEALTTTIATLLEQGERPPAPASEGKREQQVNIRLTADERLRIEETARQEGFRSLSDYIRHAALRGVR
ncbi:MAG: type II toxin-antitoxin system HicB family antitoxin [Phycisphaerales bacterium]